MKRSEILILLEKTLSAVYYIDDKEIAKLILETIEQTGMLPPKAMIKKESDGIQWEVEANQWESETKNE